MSNPTTRAPRAEPREVIELRRLRADHPELAEAVDLHLALLALHRRVQARVPTPWIEFAPDWLQRQQEAGRPLLRFEDIPLDWTDFRLVFRQTADLLRRFDALDAADHDLLTALARRGHALEPLVVAWFNAAAAPELVSAGAPPPPAAEALEQVVGLAMRPFLSRCAEVVQQRVDFSAWTRSRCPLCGGEADFGLLTAAGDRLLACGRCTARWRFDPTACPYCGNGDRASLPSFASADGIYRLYLCDACRRYLKAYDAAAGGRPLMLTLDSVATLPLDAAAVQRGYGA